MSSSLAILDRIALYAILVDQDARTRFINEALKEVISIPEGASFSKESVPEGMRLVRGTAANGDHFITTFPINGQNRLIEWSPSTFPEGDTLYIGKDVTRDRKSYAHLRELARTAADASQAKMRFLATMSHEMRTPLNGILGMNGLLLDTELDSNQRTYADAVRQSGTALLGLINDILDYSKIEAGHLELESHWFSPDSLVQGVTELLSPRAAEKGLEIGASVSASMPARLYGDEGRLRQVLLNLAGNGVKFTNHGGVWIEMDCKPGTRPDVFRIDFDVHDTGIGISEKDIQKIFEEFAQADDSRSNKSEGTGLGLAIAQQIIKAMGGTISAKSELNKGSLFSFSIELNGAEKTDETEPLPDLSELTVVAATDQPVLRDILTKQIEAVGVGKFLIAESGDEAMSCLKANPSATLLCDLSVAASEGRKLADASPNAIVLLSPLARGRLDAFRQAGFDAYLIKPIRQSSLAERIAYRGAQGFTPQNTARLDTTEVKRQETEGNRYRILLAEDNQINSVLAQAILKRAGHHVDLAANGQEAVDTYTLAPYDVVLMDMRMPVMDGLEATRRIRENGGTTPIIALTANAMSSDKQECYDAGMNDFVSKPIEPDELLSTINRWAAETSESASPSQRLNQA